MNSSRCRSRGSEDFYSKTTITPTHPVLLACEETPSHPCSLKEVRRDLRGTMYIAWRTPPVLSARYSQSHSKDLGLLTLADLMFRTTRGSALAVAEPPVMARRIFPSLRNVDGREPRRSIAFIREVSHRARRSKGSGARCAHPDLSSQTNNQE